MAGLLPVELEEGEYLLHLKERVWDETGDFTGELEIMVDPDSGEAEVSADPVSGKAEVTAESHSGEQVFVCISGEHFVNRLVVKFYFITFINQ